tara:strand:+ start:5838 stop:9680 length:3843 start_codon:yes stop_codon:yes gene_type:complete
MASSVSKRIFGADLNEDIKKVLQQRQKLAKEAQPLDSTQLDSEDYKVNFLDKDEKILTDLGSRTPFVRIWTAVQVQKHDQKDKDGNPIPPYDNTDGTFDIDAMRAEDDKNGVKRIYKQMGDEIHIFNVETYDTAVYQIGNNKLNTLAVNPNEPVQGNNATWGNNISGERDKYGRDVSAFPAEFETNKNEFFKPPAGIISANSETEGPFGLIKKTTINFVVGNFHDFDEIYSQYFLRPGARIFIDMGWDTSTIYDPISTIKDYTSEQISEILYGEDGVVPLGKGQIEVLCGNVVDYNSNIKSDGSVECSVTVVSQNMALIDHGLKDEQEAIKNRIINRLDYEIIKFAASYFKGGDRFFDANFTTDPETLDEYDVLAEQFAASNLKHGLKKNLPTDNPLKAGVYWQEVVGKDGIPIASSGKNLYVQWGLFEDLILNHEFSFGDKKMFAGANESLYDSRNNFTRWDRFLFKRQLFNDKATNLVMLYPEYWHQKSGGYLQGTYNTIRGSVPDDSEYGGMPSDGADRTYNEETDPLGTQTRTDYDKERSRIPIREIFIRTDVIKKAFKKADNLSQVFEELFDQIRLNTYEIIDFTMIPSDYMGNSIQFVDKNYLARLSNMNLEQTWFNQLFTFSPNSSTSIVNDFSVELKTPSGEMQSMIAIQALSPGNQLFPISSIIDRYLALKTTDIDDERENVGIISLPHLGDTRGLKFGEMSNLDAHIEMDFQKTDGLLEENDDMDIFLQSFGKPVNASKLSKISAKAQDDDMEGINDILGKTSNSDKQEADDKHFYNGKFAGSISEYFGLAAKKNYWIQSNSPILPITCKIRIYGISTLNPGDIFRISFLPKRYRNKVYFQITKVTHEIGSSGWTTSLETVMRLRPGMKFRKGKNNIYEDPEHLYISTGFLRKFQMQTPMKAPGEKGLFKLKDYSPNMTKLRLADSMQGDQHLSTQSVVCFLFNGRSNPRANENQFERAENITFQRWYTGYAANSNSTLMGDFGVPWWYPGTNSEILKYLTFSTPWIPSDNWGFAGDWWRWDCDGWIDWSSVSDPVEHCKTVAWAVEVLEKAGLHNFGWGANAKVEDIFLLHPDGIWPRPLDMRLGGKDQTYFMVTFGKTAWWIFPIVEGENQDLAAIRDAFIKLFTYSNASIWENADHLPKYMEAFYNGEQGRVMKPECVAANCGSCGTGWDDVCGLWECFELGNAHPEYFGDYGSDPWTGDNEYDVLNMPYYRASKAYYKHLDRGAKSYCSGEDQDWNLGVTCFPNPQECYYAQDGGLKLPTLDEFEY